jgi:hypothetical protein
MRKEIALLIAATLLPSVSCGDGKAKLPVRTSLGDLVRVEKRDEVTTDERNFPSGNEEIYYLLSFEGKGQFEYLGSELKNALIFLSLVDSGGREFRPVFMGNPNKDGALSNRDWRYDGSLTAQDGKLVFVGKLSLPEPRLTLLYSVPRGAAGLALKDGEQKYRID